MLEATSLPIEPMLMPYNFSDAWWVLSSIATLVLLSIATYFVRQLLSEFREMRKQITQILVDQEGGRVRLDDHISNSAIHCKGMDCMAINNRLQSSQ